MSSGSDFEPDRAPHTARASDVTLEAIVRSLQGLQFGSVTIIVQDGVVVQIDRTEKRRIAKRSTHA